MNPVQKFLWLLVLLAALSTATAGVFALAPLPVLLELRSDNALPAIRIAHFDQLGCDPACAEMADRIDAEFPPEEWEPRLIRLGLPPEGAPPEYEPLQALDAPPTPAGAVPLRNYWPLGDWSMTGTDGRPFGSAELAGKVWIADFMFTNCAGPCPMMNDAMKTLVGRLPDDPRLAFVSFSVDPDNDTPAALADFAKKLEAPPRWKFLTGRAVYELADKRFKLGVEPVPGADPGNAIRHSTRFTLIDGEGRMRGTYRYDYDEPEKIPPVMDRLVRDTRALLETPGKVVEVRHDPRRFLIDPAGRVRGIYVPARVAALIRDARALAGAPEPVWTLRSLPALNATLNGASFAFLLTGLVLILNRRITAHKVFMTLALVASLLFLVSYLAYHFKVGSVKYTGEGWMRPAYFSVLISHTVLAAAVAPMALVTVFRAWTARYDRHVAIARWTLPVWMYVSLTGILVYLLLYRL